MQLELNETQELVRRTAREFAQRTLVPIAAQIDREEVVPRGILASLGELGLLAVNVPAALGGSEAGVVAYSLAMSEIAAGCASTAVTLGVTNMVGEALVGFGTPAQREAYCPRLATGEILGAFALSEVEAGSDPGGMRTVAREDGDHFVLEGTKQWISHADTAGVLVVWARTGGEGPSGLTCFLVDGDAKGLSIAKHEDKMGLRGSHTCAIELDGVRVSKDALLGGLGGGFKIAMMALDGGRIGIASQSIGIAEAAHAASVQYAKERAQFGKPIAEFQAIQWMIADNKKELDAARMLTLRAASLKERRAPFTREASMAKLYASEAAWRIANRAVQIHGGYGYTREFAVERHFRDVRVTQIYEGTSEVQRIVIARSVLRS